VPLSGTPWCSTGWGRALDGWNGPWWTFPKNLTSAIGTRRARYLYNKPVSCRPQSTLSRVPWQNSPADILSRVPRQNCPSEMPARGDSVKARAPNIHSTICTKKLYTISPDRILGAMCCWGRATSEDRRRVKTG
jgi:hypothetical protein